MRWRSKAGNYWEFLGLRYTVSCALGIEWSEVKGWPFFQADLAGFLRSVYNFYDTLVLFT